MSASITVEWTRETNEAGEYVLTGTVTDTTDIDDHVFLFQRQYNGTDEYFSVCNLENMLNVQKDTPAPGSIYSRMDTMELVLSTGQEMLDEQDDMIIDIDRLVDDQNLYLNDLLKTYEETYNGE